MKFKIVIPKEDISIGNRIDIFLTKYFNNEFSRNNIRDQIIDGKIKVNNKHIKPNYKIKAGIIIEGEITLIKDQIEIKTKKMKLDILFENKDLLIVNKPPGIVIHPLESGKYSDESFVGGIINYLGENLSDLGGNLRPGIVHRLDKDTSGVLIIVKNNEIHEQISELLRNRKIVKKYYALVKGILKHQEGIIDSPIKRSTNNPSKMTIATDGKPSVTKYKVINTYKYKDFKFSLLEIDLISGRTHQIRVHFKAIGHPVCGDVIYGDKKLNKTLLDNKLKRQFLHAYKITFQYIKANKPVKISITTKLPDDLQKVLDNIEFTS